MTDKMKSFVKGILLSLVGKPFPLAEREPVAFLYNGVRLPKLPEWDSEKYPYAVIVGNSSGEFWLYPTRLILSTVPLYYVNNNLAYWSLFYGSADGSAIGYEWVNYDEENQNITYDPGFVRNEDMDTAFTAGGGAAQKTSLADDLLWANYDVYKHPGGTTLVLPACDDPVPVYE